MSTRVLRAGIVTLAVLWPLAAAAAGSLPAHAEVRAGKWVEPAAFRELVASRYQVEFKKVVAADIDRDGDIDVVATTDRSFTIWINDGAGHLTSQRPSPQGPGIDGRAPSTTWRDHDERTEPSTKDDAPTTPVMADRAHGPPVLAARDAALVDTSATHLFRVRCSAPRAPPV
jgi:hypothetical protein